MRRNLEQVLLTGSRRLRVGVKVEVRVAVSRVCRASDDVIRKGMWHTRMAIESLLAVQRTDPRGEVFTKKPHF